MDRAAPPNLESEHEEPGATPGRPVDAVVIGAGFAGLYAIHRLRNVAGRTVKAFEASDNVGGTWNLNRYPGARCDSEGYIYCYSFDDGLLQEWEWSGKYPEQAELLRYLEHVAERFDLRRSIRFGTFVSAAHFDDEQALWKVTTGEGAVTWARFLVTCLGHLSIASYVPEIEGLEDFAGSWHHTARWPREGVDLAGLRVGVIGTGSSGVQLIPVVAREAAHVTVFQRSPQYSIPARHETGTKQFLDDVKSRYADIWDACKRSAGGFPWQHNGRSALDDTPEERRATYERLWAEGGVKFALGSYRDLSLDLEANRTVSDFIREKIAAIVEDPVTREALTPYDHPFMSRRPIVDTNYFETFNRSNVALVDLRKDPIVRVTADGIQTTAGEIPLDLIVFATGFDAVTGPFFNIDIRGRGGRTLTEAWANGPQTYLGLQTHGFPNMFMITGPTSVTGNLPLNVELHVDWLAGCLEFLEARNCDVVEPSADAQSGWMSEVAEASTSSLTAGTDSWFNGGNIPGKARSMLFYFGHFGKYRTRLESNAAGGYGGFEFSSSGARRGVT